ncbi:MAG TPA: hypothetical protein VNB29_04965 [Chthoniobacterales bacterium]|nr:hypothetical protein [Chthoniobacterales bacterium]
MYLAPKGLLGLWLAVAISSFCAPAQADDAVTINFPVGSEKLAAEGLSAPPRQVATPDGMGYAEVWLRPVRKTNHIFLTFVFEEDGGKGPAVFWSGDKGGQQVTLSDNLAEGVTGVNCRTIELPDEITHEAGRLYIMGRQDRLLRLRIDWCEPSQSFVVSDQERPQLIMGGSLKLDRDLTGQAPMTPPDAWFGRVLDASLQDGVVDISQNTELVVPLKGAVGEARLRGKFLGLPLGKAIRVWVNGKLAGRLQPSLPSLTDPGYLRRGGKRTIYAGWREGAIFLEPGSLKDGENSIMFESPGKGVYLSGAAIEIESPDDDAAQVESTAPATTIGSSVPTPTPAPKPSPSPTATPAAKH